MSVCVDNSERGKHYQPDGRGNTSTDSRENIYPSLSPRTARDYIRHIGHLKAEFGTRFAADLRPRDFGPYMDVKKGKIQRNRTLAVLSCAFSEAVGRWYWLERNVLKDVKRNPGSGPRSRYVNDAEYESCKASLH